MDAKFSKGELEDRDMFEKLFRLKKEKEKKTPYT